MIVTLLFLVMMGVMVKGGVVQVEVESLTANQLDAALLTEDMVAVMWDTKNCKTCDRVLTVLEKVGEEVAENGILLVRVNDKKAAKAHAIRNFPALSFFKAGDPLHYEGDLTDPDQVLDFLSSPDALDRPGQIEDVTTSQLEVLVQSQNYVAVFFYDAVDQNSIDCLTALESIDDDLDLHGILAVKVSDTEEALQYGVKNFPSIIVFVKRVPELFEGDVTDESAVLGWALTQAGIKISEEEEKFGDILSFSAVSADNPIPQTPKVMPTKTDTKPAETLKKKIMEVVEEEVEKKIKEVVEEEMNKDLEKIIPAKRVAEVLESEEEIDEKIDTIKNDNNAVAFFYATSNSRKKSFNLNNELTHKKEGDEEDNEEDEISCWPLTCVSGKEMLHKKLNIDKLTSRPLYRVGLKPKDKPVGFFSWIFGSSGSKHAKSEITRNEQLKAEEEDEDEEEEGGEDKEEKENNKEEDEEEGDMEDDEGKEQEEDDYVKTPYAPIVVENDEEEFADAEWYVIRPFGSEDWLSVNLFGVKRDEEKSDDRDWFEVDLSGEADNNNQQSWYDVNLLGDEDFFSVNLLGDPGKDELVDSMCHEVYHDKRHWYDVSLHGQCNQNTNAWYNVDLFSIPGAMGKENDGIGDEAEKDEEMADVRVGSILGVDLLDNDYESPDTRNWYEVDLFNDVISAEREDSSIDSKIGEDEEDEDDLPEKADKEGSSLEEANDEEEDDEVLPILEGEKSDLEEENSDEMNEEILEKVDDNEPEEDHSEESTTNMPCEEEEDEDEDEKSQVKKEEEAKLDNDEEETVGGGENEKNKSVDDGEDEQMAHEEESAGDGEDDEIGTEEVSVDEEEDEEKQVEYEFLDDGEDEDSEDLEDSEAGEETEEEIIQKTEISPEGEEMVKDEEPDKKETDTEEIEGEESDNKHNDEEGEDSYRGWFFTASLDEQKDMSEEEGESLGREDESLTEDESIDEEDEEEDILEDDGEDTYDSDHQDEDESLGGYDHLDEVNELLSEYESIDDEDGGEDISVDDGENTDDIDHQNEEGSLGGDDQQDEVNEPLIENYDEEDDKEYISEEDGEHINDSGIWVNEEESETVQQQNVLKTDIEKLLDDKPNIIEELTNYILAKILEGNIKDILQGKIKAKDETIHDNDEQLVEEADNLSATASTVKHNRNVIVFTYEKLDKISKKIISGLEKVEGNFMGKDISFLTVDIDEVPDLGIPSVPSLIYFKNGDPVVYEDNLMNEEAIRTWVETELNSNLDVIEDLNSEQIHSLVEENDYVMVFLYAPECETCDEAIKQLEQIDDDTDAVGVKFVKTDEADFAEEFGIDSFPAILYFENQQPSIYDGDSSEETELLTWLLYQMKEDTIENINRDLLNKMVEDFEFLAVYFYEDNEESVKVLRHLELIDDEASQYGVHMVKILDPLMSKKYGHRGPPGLGYFRKGNYVKFDGDLYDEEEILDWLTDPNVMEISDQIEKVNKKMFEKLISRNEFLTVLFYSDMDCKQCASVLAELENIDDDAETAGIPIVKLEDKQLAKTVGVFALPAVVFFKQFGEEAVIYSGDLKKEEAILEWLIVQKDPSREAIEELDGDELRKTVENSDAVAVFIYSYEDCETCLAVLTELENIDDDVGKQKIAMVKTTDKSFAEEVGVETYPALVLFQAGVPNLYEGDLAVEEEVLDWLIEMKVESHIELITRPMLETMVEEVQYLAVFFYKQNCRTCDQVIAELENIDDDCDMFGIQLVKLKDPQLAKRYGIKTFPALVYFRNGNPLAFDGDLKSEDSVMEWLVDDDNRELEDEIEAVNVRMLDKLLETSPLLVVFFYDDECVECEAILDQLENIDDEADSYGIDFVKNDDPHAARQYNIYNTPALVYFRSMSPIMYDGDLMDDEKILEWVTSQDVFELKDEIEEVNRKLLEKLLDENEFVAVYFFEDNCLECDEVMEGLEKIDDETDALDITFVKINDPRYAKKYGVNKLPALVYFRRKFPSIYRDSLFDEDSVLSWLTSNRYKQLELGVFMYAIVSLAVTFMAYTAFLMFGLKPREPEKKKED